MKVAGHDIPDKCPEGCKFADTLSQGSPCHRCPIFNCSEPDPLLQPDDYREDWAEAWEKWFKAGMAGEPVLRLGRSK